MENKKNESSLSAFYSEQLFKSVDNLFCNTDIDLISEHLTQLFYYTTSPEMATQLEKKSIVDFANDQMLILAGLSKLSVAYKDAYYNHYHKNLLNEA